MKTTYWMVAGIVAGFGSMASASAAEVVEISAPILPQVLVLYAQEGAAFPSALADEQSLADSAALVFETLLVDCKTNPAYAGAYDGITLWNPGDPPLPFESLILNYSLVARCSYEQFTAKPDWIPKLVDDVDLCDRQLGTGWRLLSEADLASFTDADFQMLHDTLSGAADGDFWGGFYFTLHVYVRAADGRLVQGDLEPGASSRIIPFPDATDWTRHYESDLSLRCIRITPEE